MINFFSLIISSCKWIFESPITKIKKSSNRSLAKSNYKIRKYFINGNLINNNCKKLVLYENKIFLKPILNIQDKLITPIIYNDHI